MIGVMIRQGIRSNSITIMNMAVLFSPYAGQEPSPGV